MEQQPKPPALNTFTIALFWIALLAVGSFFFDDILDNMNNPNQTVAIQNTEQGQQLILERNRQGHYVATGKINGQTVDFLLDTGATHVAIPEHLATRLQLKKGPAHQTVTANGTSTSYITRLDTVSLGHITLTNVPASISTGMQFDEILLGMSFLKHLKITQQGKYLTLSVPDHQ